MLNMSDRQWKQNNILFHSNNFENTIKFTQNVLHAQMFILVFILKYTIDEPPYN